MNEWPWYLKIPLGILAALAVGFVFWIAEGAPPINWEEMAKALAHVASTSLK